MLQRSQPATPSSSCLALSSHKVPNTSNFAQHSQLAQAGSEDRLLQPLWLWLKSFNCTISHCSHAICIYTSAHLTSVSCHRHGLSSISWSPRTRLLLHWCVPLALTLDVTRPTGCIPYIIIDSLPERYFRACRIRGVRTPHISSLRRCSPHRRKTPNLDSG